MGPDGVCDASLVPETCPGRLFDLHGIINKFPESRVTGNFKPTQTVRAIVGTCDFWEARTLIGRGSRNPLEPETTLRQVLPAPDSSFAFQRLRNAGRSFFPGA
jgi:hypothetical protein